MAAVWLPLVVEVEGIEPSSKKPLIKLSFTRLVNFSKLTNFTIPLF